MPDAPTDTVTETTDAPPEQPDTPTEPADTTDWKAEAEKFKALHKKQEERAKSNAQAAKELEALRLQSLTDQERAVEEAKALARSEVTAELGGELVSAEFRAAAAGRPIDVDALLEGLSPAKFLGEDGRPDRAAITAWVDRLAPAGEPEEQPAPLLDLGQGARQTMALNGDPLEASLKSALGMR